MAQKLARRGIYAGSFDPITLGHLDIITRASHIFDEVIVAVGVNTAKISILTVAERMDLLKKVCKGIRNVRIDSFEGLVADYALSQKATALVRGLRSEADFAYEMPMAQANRTLASSIETVFIPAGKEYCYISSSLVREVVTFGGSVAALVPPIVSRKLSEKMVKRKSLR